MIQIPLRPGHRSGAIDQALSDSTDRDSRIDQNHSVSARPPLIARRTVRTDVFRDHWWLFGSPLCYAARRSRSQDDVPSRAPKVSEKTMLDLVDLVYEAALQPTVWPHLLARVAEVTHSEVATFHLDDFRNHRAAVRWYHNVDPSLVRAFEERWASENIYVQAAAGAMLSGAVLSAEDFIADRDALRTEYVNEFLLRLGVLHNIGAVVAREGSLASVLYLLRRYPGASYGAVEIQLVRLLTPHLQRAIAIHRRLNALEMNALGLGTALDRARFGTFLVGAGGLILFANRTAEAILQRADGLCRDREGRLTAKRTVEAVALSRLFAAAHRTRDDLSTPAGGSLQVSRLRTHRPYSLLVAPFPMRSFPGLPAQPIAVVFVGNVDQQFVGLETGLAELYGLTRAEARVTRLLLEGVPLGELPQRLSVSSNTIRTQVKQVFNKIGVRSQSELMRILLEGLGGWLGDVP